MRAMFSAALAGFAALPQDTGTHEGEVSMSAAVQMTPRRNMTEAEWQARCDLAALYHICDYFEWTDTINTHIKFKRMHPAND